MTTSSIRSVVPPSFSPAPRDVLVITEKGAVHGVEAWDVREGIVEGNIVEGNMHRGGEPTLTSRALTDPTADLSGGRPPDADVTSSYL